MEQRQLHGRTVIYTDVDEVDANNVVDVLKSAVQKNQTNVGDINYLYDYYRGVQPVLDREKDFNDNICNKIVENRANEIVSFKTGYFLSAPIQYIDAGEDEVTDDLKILNGWTRLESKDSCDLELTEDFSICGTGYRMVLPKEERIDDSDAPFEFFRLDPATTFVAYSSKLGHKPVMGVTFFQLADEDKVVYNVYTKDEFFTIIDDTIQDRSPHVLGAIPIIEYPANKARLGDFEIVIPLLDAINNIQSNRADGVEQFIQSILCLENMQLEEDEESGFMTRLKEVGGLLLPEGAKAYYLSQQLNQGDTQTLKDDLYDAVLYICGMPNRNGGSSTSDTGSAVLLRDGWADAEARAKITESYFKKAERKFLNMLITLSNDIGKMNIMLSQLDIRFPRRNYTNDSAKVTNLVTMLSCDKIAPQQAFEHSDMFPDPDAAYLEAKKYAEELEKKQAASLMNVSDGSDMPDDAEDIE
ncbi:MAG: phage portal protein [Clostridiales bacterium]|nr:phage portal protein [Clostridiales bacterium]